MRKRTCTGNASPAGRPLFFCITDIDWLIIIAVDFCQGKCRWPSNFEAWVHEEGEWKPPTNQEWVELMNPHLITIRLAWHTMYLDNEFMLAKAGDPAHGDTLDELLRIFGNTADWLFGLRELIIAAAERQRLARELAAG